MRRTMIDTDSMSVEEVNALIRALRAVRARKLQAEELQSRMNDLLTEAKENGFIFIDQSSDQIWTGDDVVVYDER